MLTPEISAAHVADFCAQISAEPLLLVPIRPFPGTQTLDCHNNVDLVNASGHPGCPIHGWHITEWPGVFIEAERHTIWKDERYWDPTPHIGFRHFIAFLPDPSLGELDFPDNICLALVDDRNIEEFLESSKLLRQCEREGQFPLSVLIERNQSALRRIVSKYGPEQLEFSAP